MSYYSTEGATIQEGAAGIGVGDYYLSMGNVPAGRLRAFKDGSLGRRVSGQMRGIGEYVEARAAGGGVHAFKQGILSGLGQHYDDTEASLHAWRDGVFSYQADALDGPLRAWNDGSLGQAPGGGPTLNLKDPVTMQELKSVLVMSVGTPTPEAQQMWGKDFIDDPIWGPTSVALWNSWLLSVGPRVGVTTAAAANALTAARGGNTFPNAKGVATALSASVASPGFPGNPAYFTTNFPRMSAWFQQFANAGADGKVTDPYFTVAQKTKGDKAPGGIKISTVAWIGAGGVAAFVGYMVFRKKKRAA